MKGFRLAVNTPPTDARVGFFYVGSDEKASISVENSKTIWVELRLCPEKNLMTSENRTYV